MYFRAGFTAYVFKQKKSFNAHTGSKSIAPARLYIPYIYIFAGAYIYKPFKMPARDFNINIPAGKIQYIQNSHLTLLPNGYIQEPQ